jgi:hypothetical protein
MRMGIMATIIMITGMRMITHMSMGITTMIMGRKAAGNEQCASHLGRTRESGG